MLLVVQQKASGIWKEIMGNQAGGDVLILPTKYCFVIYVHPCVGIDVYSGG